MNDILKYIDYQPTAFINLPVEYQDRFLPETAVIAALKDYYLETTIEDVQACNELQEVYCSSMRLSFLPGAADTDLVYIPAFVLCEASPESNYYPASELLFDMKIVKSPALATLENGFEIGEV